MMSEIFEVRAQSGDRVHSFGARRTRAEAEDLLVASQARVAKAGGTNDRYWIETIDTTNMFEIPSRPTPRERFVARPVKRPGDGWTHLDVAILDQTKEPHERVVYEYERNYAMLGTFEPFRQDRRNFALISPNYTATTVVDLDTREIVASEPIDSWGFCPVGFYVPDWWDVRDGSILPGSMHWSDAMEWPSNGQFGFVWGCIWGDDSSWKVQYLDLSEIQEGILTRDERFGYRDIEITDRPAKEFIRCSNWDDRPSVTFLVPASYDLTTGAKLLEEP